MPLDLYAFLPDEVTLDKRPIFRYCLLNWPIVDLWPRLAYQATRAQALILMTLETASTFTHNFARGQ